MKAILTYHSIDSSGSVISVTPETFDAHVRQLATGPATVLSLDDLVSAPANRDAVAITFDDAYTNFATEAWPRLEAHGLTATLFVPTSFVGGVNDWRELPGGRMPRLPILGWDALARLQAQGVVLGAHTRTHPDLRSVQASALGEEIAGAAEDIARNTGRRPTSFAYPYGFWTPAAASAVRAAYACACTTELRPIGARDDAHLLPRLDTYYLRGPARLERFGTWTFREYLRLRLGLRTFARRVRGRSAY